MTAGVERAFISELAPKKLKDTMLGLHSTLAESLCSLPVLLQDCYGNI